MKKKLGILFMLAAMITLIATIIFGPKYQEAQLKLIQGENELTKTTSLQTNGSTEEQELGFFHKIKNGDPYKMLVIGNGEWAPYLSDSIKEKYKASANIDLLHTSKPDVFQSWIEYSRSEEKANDLIILALRENESNGLKVNEYAAFYESLLREILGNNEQAEVIVVVNNVMEDDYAKKLQELARYYNVSYVDTRIAFEQSVDQLTIDGSQPNEEGHILYAKQMFDLIRSNVFYNKAITREEKEHLFKDSTKFTKMNVISTITMVENIASLGFTGSLVAVTFATGASKGVADIYLDGQYIQSFDTYSENDGETTLLLNSSLADGDHALTVQPSILTNENAIGAELEVLEVITN
ncbi:hypothetical protein HNQ94_002169 [Salirhabdus euzebyi]|uniref:Uncharacterized protein n=1 Tax=Salirhabdus euzebyi TaxID=394506 RepID=A0A841Q5P1_9BACI|nr:hypothetical protein [Salirhabdus euzebyi]MBB6453720.1 hypothetical protein [Salirhabdus euzebyi]